MDKEKRRNFLKLLKTFYNYDSDFVAYGRFCDDVLTYLQSGLMNEDNVIGYCYGFGLDEMDCINFAIYDTLESIMKSVRESKYQNERARKGHFAYHNSTIYEMCGMFTKLNHEWYDGDFFDIALNIVNKAYSELFNEGLEDEVEDLDNSET